MQPTMLCMMLFIINLILINMFHPLTMTLTIIVQTIITCLILGYITYSYWFSYILFLIFLGGMLVLFSYMTSLASNEFFSSTKIMNLIVLPIMILPITILFIHLMPSIKFVNCFTLHITNTPELPNNLTQLFNFPNNIIMTLIISYLFFTLIIIVKITSIHTGPLRQLM